MFSFNSSTIACKYLTMRRLSKATISPKITIVEADGTEVRCELPTAVARRLRLSLGGATRFTVPYPVCVTYVGDRIVCVEAALGGNLKMFQESGEWFSYTERNLMTFKRVEGLDSMAWDGQYAYLPIAEVVPFGDSGFGSRSVTAYNLFTIDTQGKFDPITMATLCFNVSGRWVESAPVIRQSADYVQILGDADGAVTSKSAFALTGGDAEVNEIERINRYYYPNLRFVTYVGKALADQFGYETIEPLCLPLLMIEHQTFNLAAVPKAVSTSARAPMSMKHALAWLIGLERKIKTLDDLIVVKSCLKMLLSKGNTSTNWSSKKAGVGPTSRTQVIQDLKQRMECAETVDLSAALALSETT